MTPFKKISSFEDMESIFTLDTLMGLLMLTSLEVVLGIDNIVYIAIVTGRLPVEVRSKARRVGLILAMVMRLGLLASLKLLMGLTQPLFEVFTKGFSGKDLILFFGGLFLMAKAVKEMHALMDHHSVEHGRQPKEVSFKSVIFQIMIVDLIFSLDSVITAVGMIDSLWVMASAIIISVLVMVIFANGIADFIEKNPTMKMLALSFLVLIGVFLVADSLGQKIPKGYIYFTMVFSLGVEFLNQRAHKRAS